MINPLVKSKDGYISRYNGPNSRDPLFSSGVLKDMNHFKECLEVLQIKIIDLEVITKEIAASLASTDQKNALKLLRGTWKYPTRKIVRKIPSLYQKVIKSLKYFPRRHASYLKASQSEEISYETEFKSWIGIHTLETESLFATISVALGYNKEGTIYTLLKEKRYKETFFAIKSFRTKLTGILAILNSSLASINKIIKKEEKRRDYLLSQAVSEKDFEREVREANKRYPYK